MRIPKLRTIGDISRGNLREMLVLFVLLLLMMMMWSYVGTTGKEYFFEGLHRHRHRHRRRHNKCPNLFTNCEKNDDNTYTCYRNDNTTIHFDKCKYLKKPDKYCCKNN